MNLKKSLLLILAYSSIFFLINRVNAAFPVEKSKVNQIENKNSSVKNQSEE